MPWAAYTTIIMITVETAEELIESSKPPRGWWRGSRIALLGVGMILGASIARPDWLDRVGLPEWILPQALVLGLAILLTLSSLRQRRLARLMLQAFEAVQLKEWKSASGALLELLRNPIKYAQARAESLLALATVAESQHSYDTAQRLYEEVLIERKASPLQLHTTRVALAAVMLRTSQVADAVDLIDRLEKEDLPAPLRAQVEMLNLFREVYMGQAAEHVHRAEDRRRLFRDYLGTRAGYGYGLLAAAFDRADNDERARQSWHDATILVKPEELIDRFSELDPISRKYPHAERPL